MLPSLGVFVTVETAQQTLPVIDPLFSKLPLLVSISVPLEIIEPLITPKPMLLPTMLMLLASRRQGC